MCIWPCQQQHSCAPENTIGRCCAVSLPTLDKNCEFYDAGDQQVNIGSVARLKAFASSLSTIQSNRAEIDIAVVSASHVVPCRPLPCGLRRFETKRSDNGAFLLVQLK